MQLGWRGELSWEEYDPAGRLVASGVDHNLVLDQGRSALAGMLRGITAAGGAATAFPRWFHFGTGTALPAATDTALQFRETAISASGVALEAGYTARIGTTLAGSEMTGVIREVLLATDAAHPTTAWAKASLTANHVSGNSLVFNWRVAAEG